MERHPANELRTTIHPIPGYCKRDKTIAFERSLQSSVRRRDIFMR
jgi:hypothetical protein